MRTTIVSVGDVKRNVNSAGFNVFFRFGDKVVKGATLFGKMESELKEFTEQFGEGDLVDVEVVKNNKFTNIGSIALVEKFDQKKINEEVEKEAGNDFNPADKLTLLQQIADDFGAIQSLALNVTEKNIGHKPTTDGELALVNTGVIYISKELYFRKKGGVDYDRD